MGVSETWDVEADTLVDLLVRRGERQPDRRGYVFLDDAGAETPLTYGELLARARAVGGALQRACRPGDRALLLFPPGPDFVAAFFGALLGGVVAVPAYPPDPTRLARTLPRLRAIVADAGVTCVLTTSMIRGLAAMLFEMAPELAALRWIATDELGADDAAAWTSPDVGADSVAFLQYTSGSTAEPKGVMVTHGNLLHNSAGIHALAEHSPESVYVCWLPSYHDMGLVGGIVQPLYGGLLGVLMSPLAFLQSPVRWLRALTRYGGTTTPFPNFALDLCVRRVPPSDRAGLDLSRLRVACNGAEPVRRESLDRFTEAFAPYGFRAEAHYPAYGLAEATLLVTGRRLSRPMRGMWARGDALARGRVDEADDRTPGARHVVGCGTSLPDQELRIVDPDRRTPCAPDEVGEIWLRGPSVARGYWRRPEETEAVFGARLAADDPADVDGRWLRTGDLGFLSDGELFVTGRIKDLVILRGRNLYPQDVERTVELAHPQVRPGCVAAFAWDAGGEERLAVVAEVDTRRGPVDGVALASAFTDAVARDHEAALSTVVLLEPGGLPKTSSGKLQRRATRAALQDGSLPVLFRADAPAPAPQPAEAQTSATAESLYGSLHARLARLDRRATRYRFDAERDIAWDRLDEPGRHAGAALLGARVDLALLREHPEADATLQWLMAANLCDSFVVLEDAVVRFAREERAALGPTRSLDLLEDEEGKHTRVFERYGAHLRRQRPDLRGEADAWRAEADALLDHLIGGAPDRYGSRAEYHYASWLLTLFFEEFTIYVYRKLQEEVEPVQPAWLSLHAAHAQEEAQHVLTDVGYLAALRATEEERYAWSKRVFETLAERFFALFALPGERALRHLERLHPALAGLVAAPSGSASSAFALLADRAFTQTRAAAPYFAYVAGRPRDEAPRPAASPRDAAALRDWLSGWLRANHPASGRADPTGTFQSLGLDSLQMIALTGDLARHTGRRVAPTAAYDHPTVELLAAHAATAPALAAEAETPAARPGPLPLNARQERLVHVDRHDPGRVLDHVTEVYTFAPFDAVALERALATLADRHEPLRVEVRDGPDGPVQHVAPSLENLPVREVASDAADDAAFDEELRRLALAEDRTPFDLRRGPLWRAVVVNRGDGRGALVMTVHHLVFDGWSSARYREELAAVYGALLAGRVAELPPLARQQPDVAVAERAFLRSELADARRDHWRRVLGGHPSLRADLPTGAAFEGASASRALPADRVERLGALARRHGVSLYIALLALFSRVLRRRAGDDDLLLATHLFSRDGEAERRMLGYFVNVLPLRLSLPADLPLADALREAQQSWMDALEHALPVAEVVRVVRPERYAHRWMPSPVAFNMLNVQGFELPPGPIVHRPDLAPAPGFMFFDRMLVASAATDAGLWLTLWYNREAVTPEDAGSLLTELAGEVDRAIVAR